MAIEFEQSPFWTFSLAVYGTPGVAQSCIDLQDRHGVDVNILLFCAWLGASGRGKLTAQDLATALEATGSWNREVVCRLRAARRWIKEQGGGMDASLADALRRRIVNVEVECEHAEQLALAAAVPRQAADVPAGRRLEDVAGNLTLYLAQAGICADASDIENLAKIVAAALPELDRSLVAGTLGRLAGSGGAA